MASQKNTSPSKKTQRARTSKSASLKNSSQKVVTSSSEEFTPSASPEQPAISSKKGGGIWMMMTFVLLFAFGGFLLYEYQPDVRSNVQAMLPFLKASAAEEKLFILPLTIVYNAESVDDQSQIQQFIDSLVDPKKGLQNTKVDVQWLDYKKTEAEPYLQETATKYLPLAFVNTTVEEHPQFGDLQKFLRKIDDRYYFRLAPLHHLEIPSVEGAHYKGVDPSKAEVVVLEYGSFTCGYCRQMEEVLAKIIPEYEGKISFVYKHYDRGGPDNLLIQGAECAGEQNKFWEMHDELYKGQEDFFAALKAGQTDPTKAVRDYLEKKAPTVGLNTNTFLECYDSKKYEKLAQEQTDEGVLFGASGTPAFFINDTFYGQAYPYENFKAFIDEALAGKSAP